MVYGKWTTQEDARLVSLLAAGHSVKEVAADLKRSPQVVHSHMHYRGLTKKNIRAKVDSARADLIQQLRETELNQTEEDLAEFLPKEVE